MYWSFPVSASNHEKQTITVSGTAVTADMQMEEDVLEDG